MNSTLGTQLVEAVVRRNLGTDTSDTNPVWQTLGTGLRDIDAGAFTRNINNAYVSYRTNPYVARFVDAYRNIAVGSGIAYTVHMERDGAEQVQSTLDRFWYDTDNAWTARQYDRIVQLLLTGEMLMKVFPSTVDDTVGIAVMDSTEVYNVHTDAENRDIVRFVSFVDNSEKRYEVLRKNRATGRYTGNTGADKAFYFRIGLLPGQVRGRSPFSSVFEWARIANQLLMNKSEKMKTHESVYLDVEIKGATQDQLRSKLQMFEKSPMENGTVYVHNDSEKLSMLTSPQHATDFQTMIKGFLAPVFAGTGLPEYIFGLGGDVNLATASAMSPFVYYSMEVLQQQIRHIFTTIFNYVLDHAKSNGIIAQSVDIENAYSIDLPALDKERVWQHSAGLSQLVQALVLAKSDNLITDETAQRAIASALRSMGMEVTTTADEEDELPAEVREAYQRLAGLKE